MSFLRLNGLRIPCMGESPARSYEDAGRSSRQSSGQLTRDRRFLRRNWDVKTAPMSYADYKALRCWCTGRPLSFGMESSISNLSYPSDILVANAASGVAYSVKVAADGTPCYPGSRYGTYAAQFTVNGLNVWSANIASGTDASSDTTGFAVLAAGAISSSTARRWQGGRSLQLVTGAAGDGFRTAAYGCSPLPYTASFYATCAGSPGAYTARLYGDGTLLAQAVFTPLAGTWQRVVCRFVSTAYLAASDLRLEVTANSATPGTLFFDGLQLENTTSNSALPWPWVNGGVSRGANSSQLVRSLTGGYFGAADGCTLSIWATENFAPGATLLYLLDYTGNNNAMALICGTQSDNTPYYASTVPAGQVRDAAGRWTTLNLPQAPSWPVGTWHQFTLSANPQPSAGEPSLALYMDGQLQASSYSDLSAFDPATMDYLWIGQLNGGQFACCSLDEPIILPCAIGAHTARSLYDMGTPMAQAWPVLTASGDALDTGDVQVQAKIDRAEFCTFTSHDGDTHNSGVQVSLKLMEAG